MKLSRLLLFTAVATLAFATTAVADTVTLNLTNGFIATCPVGGCATVSITTSGTTATFTVSSLLDGYQFDTFGFNFTGGSLSYVANSASGAVAPTKNQFGLSGTGNEDGFGSFQWNFGTGITGGSTGAACSGSAADPDCTFSFAVTGTGVSNFGQFESLNNGSSSTWFAGHIASSTCTGFVGGGGDATSGHNDGSCSGTSVPEPASMTLLGAAGRFSGFGLALRRKVGR